MTALKSVDVGAVLEVFFAESTVRAQRLGDSYVDLWNRLRQTLAATPGEHATHVHAAYVEAGGADLDACAPVAAAFELLHAGFVVHDEILLQGDPEVRRSPRDVATALIAGDLALAGATRLVCRLECDPVVRDRLLDSLHQAVFVAAGGRLPVLEPQSDEGKGWPAGSRVPVVDRATEAALVAVSRAAGARLAGSSL